MYALGCSMGGIILSNLIGYQGDQCFIDAACILSSPIKMWETQEAIKKSLYGLYDKVLGSNLNNVIIKHEPILGKYYLENF